VASPLPSGSSLFGSALVAGDFNGDGIVDLAVGTGGPSPNVDSESPYPSGYVVLGNGDGTFGATTNLSTQFNTSVPQDATSLTTQAIAVGDLNGDGVSDLVLGSVLNGLSRTGGPMLNQGALASFLSIPIVSATASITPLSLPNSAGSSLIFVEAQYPGDPTYAGSEGSVQVSTIPSSSLALTASNMNPLAGLPVVLTAALSPHTGQSFTTDGEVVTFLRSGSPIGTGTLSGGVATFTSPNLSSGTDSFSATFPGDGHFAAATSGSVVVNVQTTAILTFSVPGVHTYGNSAFTVVATSPSNGSITYSVLNGPATLSGSTITITGASVVTLQASLAASGPYPASTQIATFAVNKAALTVAANNAARVFGGANPTFTGTLAGAVNGDVLTETFATTATAASPVGGYAIVPSVSGAALANYTIAPTNGTLTITQAGTATTFSLSNSNTTLTATVASLISGTPTGNVTFTEGQAPVGTAPLVNGVAAFTLPSAPTSDVIITAQYSGDANFTQSASPALLLLAVTPLTTSLSVPQSDEVMSGVDAGDDRGMVRPSDGGIDRQHPIGDRVGRSERASVGIGRRGSLRARAGKPSMVMMTT
jgi:hypothetical protein